MKASIVVLLLCFQGVQAIQTVLSTRDPYCFIVEPKRIGGVIDIHYTVSGVKEENTEFYVSEPQGILIKLHLLFT